jgi:hypothetical protein
VDDDLSLSWLPSTGFGVFLLRLVTTPSPARPNLNVCPALVSRLSRLSSRPPRAPPPADHPSRQLAVGSRSHKVEVGSSVVRVELSLCLLLWFTTTRPSDCDSYIPASPDPARPLPIPSPSHPPPRPVFVFVPVSVIPTQYIRPLPPASSSQLSSPSPVPLPVPVLALLYDTGTT